MVLEPPPRRRTRRTQEPGEDAAPIEPPPRRRTRRTQAWTAREDEPGEEAEELQAPEPETGRATAQRKTVLPRRTRKTADQYLLDRGT